MAKTNKHIEINLSCFSVEINGPGAEEMKQEFYAILTGIPNHMGGRYENTVLTLNRNKQ